MKKSILVFTAVSVFAGMAQANEICGNLTGYCGNGWCRKEITPTFCINGPVCHDGPSVNVIAGSEKATEELNELLSQGQNTRVCAEGTTDNAGNFIAESARPEYVPYVKASSRVANPESEKNLICATKDDPKTGGMGITVVKTDAYDAVISGSAWGGMAKFIRQIPATNVKIQHEVDVTRYENREEGMSLTIVTTPMNEHVLTTATFQESKQAASVAMTCHY